jgi:hypothetical protein
VALSGEIDDGIGLMREKQFLNKGSIFDAAVDEYVSRIVRESGEVAEIARVGQFIESDDAIAGSNAMQDEVGADKPSAASD